MIVTYLFIGVMPILLLLLMGGVAGYLFAGQFATYVAFSDLHSELQHLQAANDSLAAQLFPLESSGKLNEKIAGEFTRASDERFPGRTVTVWSKEKGFVLSTGGELLPTPPAQVPDFINADFTGFVVDQDALHLRAIKLHWGWRSADRLDFRHSHHAESARADRGAPRYGNVGSARPKRGRSGTPRRQIADRL